MLSAAEKQVEAWYISPQELLRRPPVTGLAIDRRNPFEIDDALYAEENPDGTYYVAVHIVDGGLLDPNSLIVSYARDQGQSRYYNGSSNIALCNPMLPGAFSIRNLGLNVDYYGLGAPTITVDFNFDPLDRKISDFNLYKSRLVGGEFITFEEFEQRKRGGDPLSKTIVRVGSLLEQSPGVRPVYHGFNFGEVTVSKFMLTANNLIAMEMERNQVACLYRTHYTKRPDLLNTLDLSSYPGTQEDLLDALGIARHSRMPLKHDAANLKPHAHYSSPLRRFSDLVNHMMLHALLTGRQYPFTNEELDNIAGELTRKAIENIGLSALFYAA